MAVVRIAVVPPPVALCARACPSLPRCRPRPPCSRPRPCPAPLTPPSPSPKEEKNSKNKKKEPAEGDDDDSGGEGYGGDEGNDQDDHGGDDDDSNDSHDSEDEAQGLSAKRMKCGGDNPIYEGQMLLAERLLEERKAKGTTLYLVRWHDRDATYDTWESGKYIGKVRAEGRARRVGRRKRGKEARRR